MSLLSTQVLSTIPGSIALKMSFLEENTGVEMDSAGHERAEPQCSSEGEVLVKMRLGSQGTREAGPCGVPPGDLAHRLSLENW